MGDDFVQRGLGDEAEILAAAARVPGAIPVGVVRMKVDLVLSEPERLSDDSVLADTLVTISMPSTFV